MGRRWPRRLLIACNVAVGLLLVAGGTVAGWAVDQFSQIRTLHVSGLVQPGHGAQSRSTAADAPPFTVLLIGSDTRQLSHSTGLDIGNATANAEALSDVMVLVRVVPDTHRVALLSIPRDLFVDVPGYGQAKINTAFAGGDPSRLVSVIEGQLGIQVNHFAEINFDSFEQIAEAVGGVEQWFPTPARDLNSDLSVPTAGCVLLDGPQALAFVRSREYQYELDGTWYYQQEPESDLARIQREQSFIKNVISKVERSGLLSNLSALGNLAGSITSNLTVDSGWSTASLLGLTADFRHLSANSIPDLTYPTVNIPSPTGISPGLERVPAADAATVAQFLAASPTPQSSPADTTTVPPTTAVPTTAAPTTAVPPSTTTTVPADGSPYASATDVVPSSSSYVDGVYVPPGRTPGQAVSTCGE